MRSIAHVIEIFACCLFTWRVLITVVPAFLLAGALAAFVPRELILRLLGRDTSRLISYPIASVSGVLMPLCSCNVVPIFVGVFRGGAGIGPATAFLYAGPALNIVSLSLVARSIGWNIAAWRAIFVPVIAVCCGLAMEAAFRRRPETLTVAQRPQAEAARPGRVVPLMALLLAATGIGASELPAAATLGALAGIAVALGLLLPRSFDRDELAEWMRETWWLLRMIVPVLVPAVAAIGLVLLWVDIDTVAALVGDDTLPSVALAALFGELVYFPILAEVVFAKAMMQLAMAPGPAMAILLTGTGASLAGALALARCIGWRHSAAIVLFETLFCIAAAFVFGAWLAGPPWAP
ncbi:MAG: permease [Armatimonadota bacterium]